MAGASLTGLALAAALMGWVRAAAAADPVDAPLSTAASAGAPAFLSDAAPPPPQPSRARVPAAQSTGDATDRQIAGWIADQNADLQAAGPGAAPGEGLIAADPDSAAGPRRVHGEVTVGVGTRGYREASGAVSLPVGQASEVDLAVADAHADFRHGGVEQRSIALGVYVDGRDVGRVLGRDKCAVPRWGVAERDDPVVNPDGSCAAKAAAR